MGWLWEELRELAGPNCENEVKIAAKRWRERVEPALRELTRLRLGAEQDRAAVQVRICPGLPERLRSLDSRPEERAKYVLALYRPEFESFASAGDKVVHALKRLDQIGEPWSKQTSERLHKVLDARQVAYDLLKPSKEDDLMKKIFEFNEDVLGAYFYSRRDTQNPYSHIELYWGVIGGVAKQIGCSPQAVTGVTLAHELAHAYTHLGLDAEGRRWWSPLFAEVDTVVKESLAQFYTEVIVRRLAERKETEVIQAFDRLLSLQSKVYKHHREWAAKYSPEVVRAAMLEFRVQSKRSYLQFRRLLRIAARRLSPA